MFFYGHISKIEKHWIVINIPCYKIYSLILFVDFTQIKDFLKIMVQN